MRILIVEDDFGSRRMMQRMLSDYGDCDIVVNGIEAVEAFTLAWEDKKPYDVVFMDIMMPKMDGQEALKKIRDLEHEMGIPVKSEVPVVMTTVMEDPRNVVEAFQSGGVTAYLVKPVSKEAIDTEMEKIVLGKI